MISTGPTPSSLSKELNEIPPNLMFSMVHSSIEGESNEDKCDCAFSMSIPFLNTFFSIKTDDRN